MNKLQLERWNQASLGLARSYSTLTPARKAKLLAAVEDCIDWVMCNGLDTVEDWDRSIYKDGRLAHECAGTRVDQYLWDNRYEFERERKGSVECVCGRFGDMLSACVRAGFDLAVAPSGGVLGFTVGDLRIAVGPDLPDWVVNWFSPPLPADVADAEELWL